MELYTSLVRLKQALNGGHLPPMTPIPANLHEVIDPALTIGMGALYEDAERGLRCPVRGCGEFRHILSAHLNNQHGDVGGAKGIKRLLDIPHNAPLLSSTRRDHMSAQALERHRKGTMLPGSPRVLDRNRHKTGRAYTRARLTVGARNLINSCQAQLAHALIDLEHRIGRSPTAPEARLLLPDGGALVQRCQRVFGSWNNAKAYAGLPLLNCNSRRMRYDVDSVLVALGTYYDEHRTLPSVRHAQNPTRAPLIPSVPIILRAFKTKSWPQAMRRAAALLNIYGGRYGLPESSRRESAA